MRPGRSGGTRVEVRDVRAMGVHGVLPEEQERPQPFSIDLTVWLGEAAAAAAGSDDLADTADYGVAVTGAVAVVERRSFRLLEALATAVADEVLGGDPRIEAVSATVRKLRPPLAASFGQGGSVGVRVLRRRAGHRAGPAAAAGGPDAVGARRAFIGLGSNLGDRRSYLRQAVARLESHGDVAALSPLYETEPLGGPAGQDPYLNVVVELRTVAGPRELLGRCQDLEAAAARVRTVRHGPRTLDADVLLVGDLVIDQEDLQVPHPRMWERRFVLAPLRDVAPELVSDEQVAAAAGDVRAAGSLDD